MIPKNALEFLARPMAVDPRFLASFFSKSILFGDEDDWWNIKTEKMGDIAVVHARGGVGNPWWGFEAEELANAVEEAATTNRAVVLEISSPGGVVDGVPDAAARIAGIGVPLVAHTASLMCSAAYWLASGADAILASTSGEVGSIGVYCPMIDDSELYKEIGIKIELAKTGELKGMGFPGTGWTDAQKAHMQQLVDDIFADFRGTVTGFRPDIPAEAMTGGSYIAKRAVTLGLVDDVGALDAAISLAASLADARTKTAKQ